MKVKVAPAPTSSAMDSKDTYFNGQEGVLQVFDFDYEKISEYKWKVDNNNTLALFACFPPLCLVCGPFHFICGKENLDSVKAQHVAITQDGIRYIVEKHKKDCRFDFQDQGKTTKTVPYDKLTDCDIEEPAGAEGPICCMVNRVLDIVNVDTASGTRGGEGQPGHELTLEGLTDPQGFKNAVWACKRGEHPGLGSTGAPQQQVMGGQTIGAAHVDNMSELAKLLQRNNELLEEIARNTAK